ncbi:MAG: hypothetical protein ACKOCK_11455 [Chloroflexota bacterium]
MSNAAMWVAVATPIYAKAILGNNWVRVPLVLGTALVMSMGFLAKYSTVLAGN